ncbi:MAG: hypothetical protein FWC21_04655 [Treponema sp.]|nr:hypothetical protein [Treponema sp.]
MIIDEWGTWFDAAPGTNPGFLFQQNTMRDALVASVSLNIFNKHCDRVKMANIAQMVNVLQAVILTEGEKMILTPTYHVFDLYKKHQDADLIDSYIETTLTGAEESQVPDLHVSASRKGDEINITIANLSADKSKKIDLELPGFNANKISAKILSGKINAYNDFTDTEKVKLADFSGFTKKADSYEFTLPECSVTGITVSA